MKFNVKCVWNFLKENGFVFTVRSYNSKDQFVPVEGIGKCWRKKLFEVKSNLYILGFVHLSGFLNMKENDFTAVDKWWQTIEKFCKGKSKYLYLVVKVE